MPEKHCKNCTHSVTVEHSVTEDFELVPELDECINTNVTIKFMESFKWDPKRLAKNCKHYQPEAVGRCGNCKAKIDGYAYNWDLFSESMFGEVPVCSKDCKKELDKKVENYLKNNKDNN